MSAENERQIYLEPPCFFPVAFAVRMVRTMFENVSNPLKLASVALVVISMYVLMFSGLSFAYRIGITAFIFVLLLLFSFAFQTLEELEKKAA
jgi:hypothetical protein